MSASASFEAGDPSKLTNKEQRLARKAEKRSRAQVDDVGETSTSAVESNDVERQAKAVAGEDIDEEEVEAVSHKELRKRRKLEKQAARRGQGVTDVDGDAQVKPEAAGTVSHAVTEAPKPTRSPYSLWIGNMSFQTSPDRIQGWLQENGIEGITRMHMPKGVRKMEYNRGFCYVDVPSVEMVKAGVALSEGHLDGRKLLIKSGSDYSGRPAIDATAHALASRQAVNEGEPDGEEQAAFKGKTGLTKTAQKILRAQKHPPGPTLFIGNLGFNTTEESLRQLFEHSASVRTEAEDKKAKSKGKKAKKAEAAEDDGESSSEESESDEDEAGEGKEAQGEVESANIVGTDEKSGRPTTSGQLRGAGIRKVRLGQFEDTGKCKGFAFIDFFTPAYSTASLIDPHNSFLDGRQLVVQYAGAEAIRRGAPKKRLAQDEATSGAEYRPRKYTGGRVQRDAGEADAIDVANAPAPGTFDPDAPLPKKHKETKEERMARRDAEREAKSAGRPSFRGAATAERREKPGAALANAQRGKVSIDFTAPRGAKKTFD